MGRGVEDTQSLAALVAAALIFYLAPWAPLYVLAFLVLTWLTWRRLDLALTLVVLFAPLYMLPKHLGHLEFAPSELFIVLDVLVALIWLARPATRVRFDLAGWRQSPFFWPAVLFLVAATLSTLLAADRHQALQAYRERVLEPLAFFALLLTLKLERRHWIALLGALLAAGLYVSVIGLGQRALSQNVTVDAGTTLAKIRSVYGSPDNVGLLLDRVLPVWLALVLAGRRLVRVQPLWYLAGLVLIAALVLSFSRGAWIALAITALAQIAFALRRGWWASIAAAVLVGAALLVAAPRVERALSSGHSGTVQSRGHVWHAALKMLHDRPVFGVGPDNFLHYYAPKPGEQQYVTACAPGLGYYDRTDWREPCLSHPHNEFLDFWLSTGIAGLIAFLWLLAVFWRQWGRLFPPSHDWTRILLLGAGGAMLASLLHGLVDNSYFLPDLAVLFWLLCGYVSFAVRERGNAESPAGASPLAGLRDAR